MAEYPNPPISTSAPTDGQVLAYQASTNTWIPITPSAGWQGPQGATGAQGAQGATGAQGPQGPQA